MQLRSAWLTEDERQTLIDEAFSLLERVGMKMSGARALAILAENGVDVDHESGVARIPRHVAETALARCPSRVLLAGAAPDKDVALDGTAHFCISGTASHAVDMVTGEHRLSTCDDLRKAVIVTDAMSEVDLIWSAVVSNDLPEERRKATEWPILVGETGKPVKLSFDGMGDSPLAMARALFEVLSGDLAGFKRRPRACVACCTASPLMVNGRTLDQATELAGLGAPIIVYPMPIAAATAPVTLGGTMVLNLAEFIGVATAIQFEHPGAPLIAGCGAAVLDMRCATYSLGALEGALMSAGLTEAFHGLGIPVSCPGVGTDAKYPGVQAGYEKALKGVLTAIGGADLITGSIGLLNGANTLYLPQIVIDNEIAAMIKRGLADVDLSPANIMSEAIERVGIGGHFLAERETRARVRAGEHYLPSVATRLSYDTWQATGRREDDIARETVDRILAARDSSYPYLTDDQVSGLRAAGFTL